MDFVYFGLSFYHLKTVIVGSIPKLVAVDKLEEFSSEGTDMLKTIKDDLRELEDSEMGGKGKGKWKVGKVVKVSLTKSCVVYLYHHQQHAAFSATKVSQLLECQVVKHTPFTRPRLPTCEEPTAHAYLQPYFLDNTRLLEYYEKVIEDGGCDALHTKCEQLRAVMNSGGSEPGTAFECPTMPVCNWSENDWTKRLAKGIEEGFPKINVTFSALSSLQYFNILQMLHLPASIPQECYLFRGAPDILLHKYCIVSGSQEEVCSSEDEVLENSHQRNPLKGHSSFVESEKLGELIAALHFLLVSKFLRKVFKGKSPAVKAEVRGLLVDKILGAFLCTLSADLSKVPASLEVSVTDFTGSSLTPDFLCGLLKTLLKC